MVQIQQKGGYGVGNPLLRSFLCGTRPIQKTCERQHLSSTSRKIAMMCLSCQKSPIYVQRDLYLRKTALEFDFAQDCDDVLIMSKEPYICTKRLVYVQRDMHKNPIQKPCDSSWPRRLRSSYVNVQRDLYMYKETYICTKRPRYVQRDLYKRPRKGTCERPRPCGLRSSCVCVCVRVRVCVYVYVCVREIEFDFA